jgi:predicted helicase
MPQTTLKPDSPAMREYYRLLKEAEGQDALHEGNVRNAFQHLLRETARDLKGWELVTEESIRREGQGTIRYDGTLRDTYKLPHGWWEAKDTRDDLDTEIRKKRDKGYRFDNIIFEDTREAVLFQDNQLVTRVDVQQADKLADLLSRFYSYEIEPFTKFAQAVSYFQNEIPHIANGLKEKIEGAHRDNKRFQAAYEGFMELCRASLNPNIAPAAVDEMLIQHMLTERLIRKVFDVEEFTRRNVIAAEVENVIDALSSGHFNRTEFLGALDRFYTVIEEAADRLANFTEKQDFINHVYERFFQGYSVKVADTHGIVYTPQPIVDFMCAAVEEVLLNEFGAKLGDEGVTILDPATGTGNFIVNLLRRGHERNPRQFERFYREQLFANEVMLMPYYIASLNIEHEFYKLTGRYEPFEGVCFVDTLDMAEGAQMKLAFMTAKNTARVERQKQAPITVIIGNPPYNVGQLNENDNNKNRKYEEIDKRVAETYSKDSKASSKTKLNDPYVKFFRWAVDRLQGHDGIVCYVSNNSFVDQIAFDGMRKHLLNDFTEIYHLDLHGNVRQNPKLSGTTHNVFGIQVGVGVTVAVRKRNTSEPHPLAPSPSNGEGEQRRGRLFYHRVPELWTKREKLAWLDENVERLGRQNALNTVEWEELKPDSRNTWLVPENADEFAEFLAMGGKESKAAKGADVEAIFKLYSLGVSTNRDEVAYNFSRPTLIAKVKQFIDDYNSEVDRYRRANGKMNIDSFVNYEKVKWSGTLKLNLERGRYAEYHDSKVRSSIYRPFTKKFLFYDSVLNERPREFSRIFSIPETQKENLVIWLKIGSEWPMFALMANSIVDLLPQGGSQCFPFYVYDADGTNRRENITDWALGQFQEHYDDESISKWDIFWYVYGLLHHPGYRER